MTARGILKTTLCFTVILSIISFGICCSELEWECKSSECVAMDVLCDGSTDCADGSDETQAICFDQSCPSFAFRCTYGACIARSGVCNGIADCADNSDETYDQCKAKASTPGTF